MTKATKKEITLRANHILKLKKQQVSNAKELVKSYKAQENRIRTVISSYKCNAINGKKLLEYLSINSERVKENTGQ